ncbi:MAG: pantoate--beta-alanine ligase [Alphaproteobacteria bacterium]|jgi:pantoate--beta-alanine ligase
MQIIKSKKSLLQELNGVNVALVPTMGALHKGHASLVERALKENSKVVVSIFVNPLQFGANEDFSNYPKTAKEDEKILKELGVHYLYSPTVSDVYNDGFDSIVRVQNFARGVLCDVFRPNHFNGVLTVVLKLFNQIRPVRAYFGEKDFQQLVLIKKMVKDLDLGVEIITCPIVREENGLAMSSRNQYLSNAEKKLAGEIYNSMVRVRKDISLLNKEKQRLITLGFNKIDYFEIRNEEDFSLVSNKEDIKKARIFFAGFLNKTRLIDNMGL